MSLPEQLKMKRKEAGLSQKKVAELLNTSERQIRRMESPEEISTAGEQAISEYREFLGLNTLSGELPKGISKDQIGAAVRVVRTAVADCMNVAIRVLQDPHRAGTVVTRSTKYSDIPLSRDKTTAVDQATSMAFVESIRPALEDANGPFKNLTVVLVDEEGGHSTVKDAGPEAFTLVLMVDSCDDTSSALRFVGGMVLASIYLESVGFVGSVAGDLVRFTLYSRTMDESSIAMQMDRNPIDVNDITARSERKEKTRGPQGTPFALTPDKHGPHDCLSICCYMGKGYRVKSAANDSGSLFDPYDAEADDPVFVSEVLSLGGSRGCTFVAEGLLQAAVEITKGFRLVLDAFPGIDICIGSGATVIDLDTGDVFERRPNGHIEDAIASGFSSNEYAELSRVRFVAASTLELARILRAKILDRG